MLSRLRRTVSRLVSREVVHDIVSPTERERVLADVERRRRRYLRTGPPMLALLLFALLVPAPAPVRVGAAVGALLLAPFAIGSTVRW